MQFLSHLSSLTLTRNDLILLIPMALAGVVLTGALPCHTRVAHYSFEVCGAVVGIVLALCFVAGLPLML